MNVFDWLPADDLHYNVIQMTDPAYLGEFEQLVLLAVLRLEDDAYGATIRRLIEDATGRDVSIGAIYTTLDRLLAKGLVTSHVGEPTGGRGGRRRKIYTLERSGRAALARAYASWANMTRGLKPKLS
jgi:DNA-binding PadR family transcriptional regulator